MKKRKKLFLFLGFLAGLWCLWMWEVGFNTGKYSRQETPFNVPAKIVKSARESMAAEKYRPKLIANNEALTIGKIAPDFSLPGQEENEIISLSDFRGKVVLLEFWASWCGDCRRSNSYLLDIYEQYQGNKFEVIGISMDRSLRSWKKAIRKDQIIWPQACDGKGVDSEVIIQYGILSIPANLLLDEQGVIVGKDMSTKEIGKWLSENR